MLTRRATLAGLAATGLTPAVAARGRTRTLTGQQEQGYNPQNAQRELAYLQKVTGEQPAILGLDDIDPRDDVTVTARALARARSGGIVIFCWHWGAPDIGTG